MNELKNRLVILIGTEGVGKTSVLKKIGLYCYEREFYSDGVFYCCLRNHNSIYYL